MSKNTKIILGFLISGIILGVIDMKLFLIPLIIFPYYIIILLVHNPKDWQTWFLWSFWYFFFSVELLINAYEVTTILLYIVSFVVLFYKNFKK